ncbi:Multidrug resistance protein MdtN [Methylobacterium crusticola]|uniref:Multidrug resistance protein MdtN n=1 Tax=Methylobacterium crusticola TaxID=1697972 RepID=A0ABQ4R739_9HYPH|nr:HlyD family secretion protein [Methylobacterium crusticola]GJD53156.1 Multidrug resistance protein MdtN [Methylobacterium crusticola]
MEPDAETTTATSPSNARRRFWTACGALCLAGAAYLGFDALVGYTDDAYIRSDLVRIAPEVSGPVSTVHVQDNDHVEAGALLLTLDPKPFELTVAVRTDRVAGADAAVAVKVQAEAAQAATVQSAEATLDLAQAQFRRTSQLAERGFAAQETLDKVSDDVRQAQSALALATAQVLVGKREVDQARRDAQEARADLAIAAYDLTRTRIVASVPGYVNNLDVRPGRFAKAGEPVVGLVDDTQWRIVANFKEDVAAAMAPGTAVRVWLDTRPWRLWRGRVQGVARGIARDETPGQLLPYVAPTTDWIRLRRRLPVTILLDPPLPRGALFMGADARVVFLR